MAPTTSSEMPEVRALSCDSESEDTYAAIEVEKVASVWAFFYSMIRSSRRLKSLDQVSDLSWSM
eukprot:jgi/Chrpa1/15565/Chrysochromulina_OHIO_Genome00019134-RA